MLGLAPAFLNSSGIGGGCIQASIDISLLSTVLNPQRHNQLQTTASDSALVTVVAARSLYQRNHPGVKAEDLVIYVTTQTHSLGAKAALVLGIQVRAVEVTAEDNFALRGHILRVALEEDEKLGRKPFILSMSAQIIELAHIPHPIFSPSCHGWYHILRSHRQHG